MTLSVEVIQAAQKSMMQWNVPASVTLAQFGLESAWGTKMPGGLSSNNPFGIKWSGTGPFVTALTREETRAGRSYYTTAKFAKYASIKDAFDEHGKLIATLQCYAVPMHIWEISHDIDRFVTALSPIYATSHGYAALIMNIIHTSDLTQYDLKTLVRSEEVV